MPHTIPDSSTSLISERESDAQIETSHQVFLALACSCALAVGIVAAIVVSLATQRVPSQDLLWRPGTRDEEKISFRVPQGYVFRETFFPVGPASDFNAPLTQRAPQRVAALGKRNRLVNITRRHRYVRLRRNWSTVFAKGATTSTVTSGPGLVETDSSLNSSSTPFSGRNGTVGSQQPSQGQILSTFSAEVATPKVSGKDDLFQLSQRESGRFNETTSPPKMTVGREIRAATGNTSRGPSVVRVSLKKVLNRTDTLLTRTYPNATRALQIKPFAGPP